MNKKRILPAVLLLALLGAACAWRFAPREEAPQPIAPQAGRDFVSASLTYDAGTRTLRGTQHMTLTNRSGEALDEIVLRAYMNGWEGASVAVSGASIDGTDVMFAQDEDDPTVLRARCDWPAGQTLSLSFTLLVKHARTDAAALVTLPSLSMYEDGAWRTDAYDDLADPSYAQPFDFTVSVDGETVAQMREARDVSFALLPDGASRSKSLGNVRVTALAQDGSTARKLLRRTQEALTALESAGFPYPFETLTVAQADTGRADGLALSGLIALDAQGDTDTLRRMITRLVARETFGILVESDPWNAPWLSHTLASCAELICYRRENGEAAYETRFYEEIEPATRLTRPYGVTVGAPTAAFGGDGEMTQVLRDEGAAMLMGIEQAIGETAFVSALQQYAARCAGKSGSLEALCEALYDASGSRWDGYLRDGL